MKAHGEWRYNPHYL